MSPIPAHSLIYRFLMVILVCLISFSLMGFIGAPETQAATWYLAGESSQGQEQQYVDLDSIEPLGSGEVRVKSDYWDYRSGTLKQTRYVTEYHCRRRLFRDVQRDGQWHPSDWYPVDPDPLNAAVMDYVCSLF